LNIENSIIFINDKDKTEEVVECYEIEDDKIDAIDDEIKLIKNNLDKSKINL